ncbi:MAG: hypothetical protein ACTSQP_19635 [Promethearchaeota archaeon]
MLLYENKKAKLIYILKIGLNPFRKFVATGEISEDLGVVPSRKQLIEDIKGVMEKKDSLILPIIGDIGIGKTHLYWALKSALIYANTIYLSLENVSRKFYYNFYSEYIENLGVEPLRNITNKLCNRWGALEKKFGFFHIVDIEKVRRKAYEELNEKFSDKTALNDVINAITAHQLDPYKKIEAENWLLGELMDIKDLSRLNLNSDLRNKNNAFTMLKILIENSVLKTVLFIDDFEKIIQMSKPDQEEEEIFDPSYLYGPEESLESKESRKVLNKILSLLDIRGIKIIIALKSVDSLENIKQLIAEIDENILDKFEEPRFLLNFDYNDTVYFYKKNMENFLKNVGYSQFIDEFLESFFPINEKVLRIIYEKSGGNPRNIIKALIRIFNDIIFSDEKLEDIMYKYEQN